MTVIITNAYFLADFIFDEFRDDPDVAVVNFKERKNPLTSLLKWLRVKAGNRKGLFNSLLFSRGFRNALATFDRGDARLLGCRLMPQVHRRIPLPAPPAAPAGVFFVGLLKGREATLEKIAEELDAHSIPHRFHLLRGRHDRGEVAPVLAGSVAEGPMPYGEVLRCVGEDSYGLVGGGGDAASPRACRIQDRGETCRRHVPTLPG